MLTAKIFENGRSQAVRLPKECRFSSDEVLVNKIGDIVILLPKSSNWDSFAAAIDMFSDDFMDDKREDSLQEREILWDICLIPTYVYIIKNKPKKVIIELKRHKPSEICVSAITYAELTHGVEKSMAVEKNMLALALLFSRK